MLKAIDIIGLGEFIYGGDPEWVRRRWLMVVSLSVGWLSAFAACLSTAAGRLPVELAQTVVGGVFGITGVIVPGYLGLAAWDANNKMTSGAVITETNTVTSQAEGGVAVTKTNVKKIKPANVVAAEELPPPRPGE